MVTALFFCLVSLSQAPAAQPPAAAAPAPSRLSGVWNINKDISTKPATPPGQDGRGGERGGGNRSGGGGRRGGFGGGRMGGGRSGGGGRSDAAKGMALIRELGQSPESLTIVLHDGALTITDSDGVSRKFAIDGKTEKIAIGGDSIEVKSHWTDDTLEQEFKLGSFKLLRMFDTTTDGHQLVITVKPKDEDGAGRFDRFVYDRKPLFQQGLNEFARLREHRVDLRRVLAAGFGEVGTSAAATADDRRQLFHERAGFYFVGEIFGD